MGKKYKCCVIQPFYTVNWEDSDELFEKELAMLRSCDSSMDIIVLPEAGDVPALAKTREQYVASYTKYGPVFLKECSETAKRCNAMVFANATYVVPETKRERNTTYCFDRQGNIVGHYFKQHLTPGEFAGPRALDSGYSLEHNTPIVVEMEGIRFAFLTCYDFYFYEAFANIAHQNVDVIIGCSHQRSDNQRALELINGFCCYNTNTYMIRSSVTLDAGGDIGGGSMIVNPKGEVLVNLNTAIGMACAEIDPHDKYYKPAGFGNPLASHYEYIEKGRRPWKYRPGGSAMVPNDYYMSYPRLCAHRGFGAPENSMVSIASAIALGAQEVEFDIRPSKDGVPVVVHDADFARVSGTNKSVSELTLAEIRKLDLGKGIKVATFDEVLKKFSCHCIMNVHVKTPSWDCSLSEDYLCDLWKSVVYYDCEKYVYFMTGNNNVMKQIKKIMPNALTCMGCGNSPETVAERAVEFKTDKVQFCVPNISAEKVALAHQNKIICNVCYADTVEDAQKYFDMGVDTVLTNEYIALSGLISR